MDSWVTRATQHSRNQLTTSQPQPSRAARAPKPYGEEADEGFHERTADRQADQCSIIRLHLHQMYSNLVQRCFNDCVTDFTTKSLLSKEEGCVMRCVDKFLKSSERLGERFQEQNAAMAQSGSMMGR